MTVAMGASAANRAGAAKPCTVEPPAWAKALRSRLEAMAEELKRTLKPWNGPSTVFRPQALGLQGEGLATRAIQAFLFGVTAHDPITIGAACGLLAGCGLIAALIPARRAASIDPMLALRTE